MRILIRTSKWAIWARRCGSLALPLAVIPVFMHRERLITSVDFHIIEVIAMGVAALALFLAVGAFARLWVTGDQGWGKATIGLFFSLLCLGPLAFILALALRYPPVSDVTTDFTRPPGLVSQVQTRPWTPEERQAIEIAFPNARTRTYPIEAPQIYALAAQLVDAWGWEPRARREPQTPLAEGQINAVATTLLGWRDEVAIRITGDARGSVVAMRSTALHGIHDLGENGRRIEDFLAALDNQITLMMRDAPLAPAPEPATEN
ncbi:MAG: DUF1499 domain-containing protein [Devosia sp.]